ncbi:MAG: O-antigen ligase family protein [Flavobacteriales bacterium]|nr:O-antigen ligase family protein [Flavobacteriales bacterium]
MLGLLAFLPTIVFIPHQVYLLLFPVLIWRNRTNMTEGIRTLLVDRDIKVNLNFIIILLFVIGALLNRIAHIELMFGLQDYFPFCLLILLTYWAGIGFKQQDLKLIIYCVGIESLFVIAEYFMGVSTFFTGLELYTEFGDSQLMYARRPLGLSVNSSVAAVKLLLGYLLIDYSKFKGVLINVIRVLIIAAIVFTFNRSTMVALVAYYLILAARNFIKLKWPLKSVLFYSTIGLVGVALIGIASYTYIDEIVSQFTRNQGSVELSGREKIWEFYFKFISENFLYGNGSYKFWFGNYHAHNSYIQIVATHGVILSLFYVVLIIRGINKENIVYVFPILIYSLAQYGLFWGISLLDILFFVFLYGKGKEKEP